MSGGTLDVGGIRSLFGPVSGGYDVSPDGQRFLFAHRPEAKSPEPLTLIQNWMSGLKKQARPRPVHQLTSKRILNGINTIQANAACGRRPACYS